LRPKIRREKEREKQRYAPRAAETAERGGRRNRKDGKILYNSEEDQQL
jgi:hypothetical protein